MKLRHKLWIEKNAMLLMFAFILIAIFIGELTKWGEVMKESIFVSTCYYADGDGIVNNLFTTYEKALYHAIDTMEDDEFSNCIPVFEYYISEVCFDY